MRTIAFLTVFIGMTSMVSAGNLLQAINGASQCLRPTRTDFPSFHVADVNRPDIMCNVLGTSRLAPSVCPLQAGQKVTLNWRMNPGVPNFPVDPSQPGPCVVYMSRLNSNQWFKVWQDGYRNGEWCTDRIIRNPGHVSFNLPRDLLRGRYVLRAEIISLHNAATLGTGSFFTGPHYAVRCADVMVIGGMNNIRPFQADQVSFPGAYRPNDPGLLVDINNPTALSTYVVPGPRLARYVRIQSPTQPSPVPRI